MSVSENFNEDIEPGP